MTTPELHRAYRRARYRLALPQGPLDFTIGTCSSGLRTLLDAAGVGTAAFLTACNPGSRPLDPATNRAAQAALLEDAARLGHATLPGVAVDPHGVWPDEESVLVLGIDAADATALAWRFGQNALVWINAGGLPELVWVNGRAPLDLHDS